MPVADPRIGRLNFYKGEIELALGNELDAVRQFRRLSDEAPDDSLAPDALLRAADAYAALWKRPELDPTYGQTALGVYQEVQSRYPNATAAKRAEAKVRELSDQFARKEYSSALFYFKFKAYDSAILILRALVLQYPRATVVPEALEKLVLAYKALGYEEDIKVTVGAQISGPGTRGCAAVDDRGLLHDPNLHVVAEVSEIKHRQKFIARTHSRTMNGNLFPIKCAC